MELEEALEKYLSEAELIQDVERVPLFEAFGRIIAEEIRAPFAVPHFPKAAMDGYAVRAEDVQNASPEKPVILTVVGEILAGQEEPVLYRFSGSDMSERFAGCRGTAIRIMTGALVPEGYDAVVRQEDTDYGEREVQICKGVLSYTNYCKAGEDIAEGAAVLPKGRRIGRIEAGMLASLGFFEVPVLRRLRISVISTGTELWEVSETASLSSGGVQPPRGRIYNSIACTLSGSLIAAGFTGDCSVVPDEADEIARCLEQALITSDIVITTGGVSVGKKDLLPEVLDRIGAKKVFARINIQPGTPTIGSVKGGKAILSLSGNPFAALVNFDLYFYPLAAKLTGCSSLLPVIEEAILQSEYPKVNHQRRFLRARVENGLVYLPAKSHASSVLANLLECNCYIDLPSEKKVKPGDRVRIVRMPGL